VVLSYPTTEVVNVFETRRVAFVAVALLGFATTELLAQGRGGGNCAKGPTNGNTITARPNMTGMQTMQPATMTQQRQQMNPYALQAALMQNQMLIQAQRQQQQLANQQLLLTWQRQLQAKDQAKMNQLKPGSQ